MNEHFVFYDFETTGTSTKFDQPLQFGAIVTDSKFMITKTIIVINT